MSQALSHSSLKVHDAERPSRLAGTNLLQVRIPYFATLRESNDELSVPWIIIIAPPVLILKASTDT